MMDLIWRHIKNNPTGKCGAKYDAFFNRTVVDYAYFYVQELKGIAMKEMEQRVIVELNDLKSLLMDTPHHQWTDCP